LAPKQSQITNKYWLRPGVTASVRTTGVSTPTSSIVGGGCSRDDGSTTRVICSWYSGFMRASRFIDWMKKSPRLQRYWQHTRGIQRIKQSATLTRFDTICSAERAMKLLNSMRLEDNGYHSVHIPYLHRPRRIKHRQQSRVPASQ